jgi:predicted ABC-type ATPase
MRGPNVLVEQPVAVLLGGPNGAGKSTVAGVLLPGPLGVTRFVNADTIARGLSGFDPEASAMAAGRLMIDRLRELAAMGESFAFETTLASRSFAALLVALKRKGYKVEIVYLWLNDPELALARVAERVRRGGHDVPGEVVLRRYHSGLRNLFELYLPLADSWRVYDNSREGPALVAHGGAGPAQTVIVEPEVWGSIAKGREGP